MIAGSPEVAAADGSVGGVVDHEIEVGVLAGEDGPTETGIDLDGDGVFVEIGAVAGDGPTRQLRSAVRLRACQATG